MLNCYENKFIKTKKLPPTWQDKSVLEKLEAFLQENWSQRSVFYFDEQATTRQQFIDFDKKDGIKTQNYIGTIIYKGEQLNIFPKIFKEDRDDDDTTDLRLPDLIYNLIKWLEYNDKLNFPFVTLQGDLANADSLLELFITIYVRYVNATLDREPYFQYEDIRETGSFVKGKIDLLDYAAKKYPTGQANKLDYDYSGFVFDNILNRIIKCTCKILLSTTNEMENRQMLRNILMKLGDVSTIDCTPYDCDNVHLNVLHKGYRVILSMSKMFLLGKVNSAKTNTVDAICFLFPTEVLFEGFIGNYIKEMVGDKAKVRTQTNELYLADLYVDDEKIGKVFNLREDIFIETTDKKIVKGSENKEIESISKCHDN